MKKIYCYNCGAEVNFTVDEVHSSFVIDLDKEYCHFDNSRLWHYIECPKCRAMHPLNEELTELDKAELLTRFWTAHTKNIE